MIKIVCPNCGKNLETSDKTAGKKGKCPGCEEVFDIPLLEEVVLLSEVKVETAEDILQKDAEGIYKCPNCKAKIERKHEICKNCGVELFECEECGGILMDELRCPHCGVELDGGETQTDTLEMTFEEELQQFGKQPQTKIRADRKGQTSVKAIISMVCSIAGIFLFNLFYPISIVGIVLGYISKKEIRNSKYEIKGEGIAIAGIAIGWVAISITLLWVFSGLPIR